MTRKWKLILLATGLGALMLLLGWGSGLLNFAITAGFRVLLGF